MPLRHRGQPPIKETLAWLRDLRTSAGGSVGLVIALVGKPDPETVFTPPAETDRIVWEQAVQSLGDPYVRVETLGG